MIWTQECRFKPQQLVQMGKNITFMLHSVSHPAETKTAYQPTLTLRKKFKHLK